MTESFILPFFLTIRILDIIDIMLVAFLMYQLYNLMKGTVAINIFIAIFVLYLFWLVVKALNMQLMSTLLGQVMGVGVIALIIVFQQEIRRFLLMIGTRYMTRRFSLENLFSWNIEAAHKVQIKAIVNACMTLAGTYTGALIAVARNSSLQAYAETGEIINANTTERLIESIFFKNNPLHDGGVIIAEDKIYAAGCIFPLTENPDVPIHLGLRHRAALGLSEQTDAFVIVVSEETGGISYALNGELKENVDPKELTNRLNALFG